MLAAPLAPNTSPAAGAGLVRLLAERWTGGGTIRSRLHALATAAPALDLRLARLLGWLRVQDLAPLGYPGWLAFTREHVDWGNRPPMDIVAAAVAPAPKPEAAPGDRAPQGDFTDPADSLLGPWRTPVSLEDAMGLLREVQTARRGRAVELGRLYERVVREGLHRMWGFRDVESFCEATMGRTARSLQRHRELGRVLRRQPALEEAAKAGMSLARVEAVGKIAGDDVGRWVAVAARTPVVELERAAAHIEAGADAEGPLEAYEAAITSTATGTVALAAIQAPVPPRLTDRVHPDLPKAARWLLAIRLPAQKGFGKVRERHCLSPQWGTPWSGPFPGARSRWCKGRTRGDRARQTGLALLHWSDKLSMPEISLAGRRYHYLDEGSGPPLLLLHAFPLSSEAFRPQIGGLPARLLVPDHRGFGRSEGTGAGAVTMEEYARDAVALLEALNIERAIVGGVSMGGYIAMAMLRVGRERVCGLALLDTRAGPDDEAARAGRRRLAEKVLEEGLEQMITEVLPRLVAPDSPAHAQVEALIRASANPEGVAAALRGMALRPDSSPDLAAFDGPAVVIVGDQDRFVGVEESEALCLLLPNATFERIPDAGHLANLQQPEIVNEALVSFLERAVPMGA